MNDMARIRVHELAKEVGTNSRAMVDFLRAEGVFVRSASSTLDPEAVDMVRQRVAKGTGPPHYEPPWPPVSVLGLAKEFNVNFRVIHHFLKAEGIFIPTLDQTLDPDVVALVRKCAAEGKGPVEWSLTHPGPLGSHWPTVAEIKATRGVSPAAAESARQDPERVGEHASDSEAAPALESLGVKVQQLPPTKPGSDAPETGADPPTLQVRSTGGIPPRQEAEAPKPPPAPANSEGRAAEPAKTETTTPEGSTPPAVRGDKGSQPASHGLQAALPVLKTGHFDFEEGCSGVTYEQLLLPYLVGATEITITDPYIRTLAQTRNLMELLEGLLRAQPEGIGTRVSLRTAKDEREPLAKHENQRAYLDRVVSSFRPTAISFTYSIEQRLHGRDILSNTGWRIILDRGLDIFDRVPSDPLHLAHRMQEHRKVKSFYVSYLAI